MGFLADVFSGGDVPDAPNTKKEQKALKKWANNYLKPLYQQQVQFATDYADQYSDLNQQLIQQTLPMMEQMFQAYTTDRNRYEQTFVPLQDQIIQYAQGYDTPQRREEEAARRISEVSQSFAAERDNAQRRLESYGIDPSQTRIAALDRDIRAQEAMAQAQAGNEGRLDVETRGQQLLAAAQQMGQGLPGQALASGQAGSNVGQQAAGGMYRGAATGGNLFAQPVNTAGQASSNIYNAGGLKLGQFGAETGEYGMNRQQTGDIWSGIGGMVDMGSTVAGFFADGGYVDKYMQYGMGGSNYGSFDRDMFNILAHKNIGKGDPGERIEQSTEKSPYGLTTSVQSSNYESALGINPTQQTAAPQTITPSSQYGLNLPNSEQNRTAALGINALPFANGGDVAIDGQGIQAENADRIPALLSHGEYVIPADVVRAKGTEFFDKLTEKYHTPSEQQSSQAQMTTKGGLPQL